MLSGERHAFEMVKVRREGGREGGREGNEKREE
jgi:hypothetical protein